MPATADPARFILANTRLLPVPHAPELRLHIADEATELWQRTEDELGAIGLDPPYWAFAWAGGQALARYVLDHALEVRGKSVLDFGAGSGLAGIAAARAGARVLAADIDAFSLAAIALNAEANGVVLEATAEDQVGRLGRWDVVLAGDVCYERAMAQRVGDWLFALAARGARVLIGDPGRTYLPKDRLRPLAEYMVPTTTALEDHAVRRTSVWTIA
jgi:predicted nicotinamide N-methyase